uniref:Uncharacterized protein n=1 Tax=Zea mays TaxID=4577 RepID=C0HHJ3_MAIZE|nr:unknown [Zea mays]
MVAVVSFREKNGSYRLQNMLQVYIDKQASTTQSYYGKSPLYPSHQQQIHPNKSHQSLRRHELHGCSVQLQTTKQIATNNSADKHSNLSEELWFVNGRKNNFMNMEDFYISRSGSPHGRWGDFQGQCTR